MYRFIKGNFLLLVDENHLTLKNRKKEDKKETETEEKTKNINLKISDNKVYLLIEKDWKLLDLSFMGSNYLDIPLKRASIGAVVAICHFPLKGENLILTDTENMIISSLLYDLAQGTPDWLPPHMNIKFLPSSLSSSFCLSICNVEFGFSKEIDDHRKLLKQFSKDLERRLEYQPTEEEIQAYKEVRDKGPKRRIF